MLRMGELVEEKQSDLSVAGIGCPRIPDKEILGMTTAAI